MRLRSLSNEEKQIINTVKVTANNILNGRRKALTQQRLELMKNFKNNRRKIGMLDVDRDAIQLLKGMPFIFQVDGSQIYLNYELLRGLLRALNPRDYSLQYRISCGVRARLNVFWHRRGSTGNNGMLELYELPAYQTELLEGLPVLEA